MTVANHLTLKGGRYHYVRRIPSDLAPHFPSKRIQKALGTGDKRKARQAALDLDTYWERCFADLRRSKGLTVAGSDPVTMRTEGWSWPDWEALATWYGACLAEEDWRARLAESTGALFKEQPELGQLPWRAVEVVAEHISRARMLSDCTVSEYGRTRSSFVQSYVRRLGVNLSGSHPEYDRFMAACLRSELAYLELFRLREARKGGLDTPHPDTVPGPWRTATTRPAVDVPSAARSLGEPVDLSGKTLADCRIKWAENRERAKKPTRDDYLRDMSLTIADFERHTKLRDIAQIRRKHVLAYRDHLTSTTKLATQTINKKIGFVTSLMATALSSGWVETVLGPNLFVPVPDDEDAREPYSEIDLARIFAHPVFTANHRFDQVKAGGELQFWLPLISCLHGMISSEILQLGPDSIVPHSEHPDILCFNVTNAGERTLKNFARRRWIPIRRELLDLGLAGLAEATRREGRKRLWQGCASDEAIAKTSRYFSTFWNGFTRHDVGISSEGTSLYSLRHGFQDRLAAAGHGDVEKKALMGDAESGMTRRYGTKREPRVVDILLLDGAVQSLRWPFLKAIQGPASPRE